MADRQAVTGGSMGQGVRRAARAGRGWTPSSALALATLTFLYASACSSSPSSPTPSPPATTAAASAVPAATPTPLPRPVIAGDVVTFASKGYSVKTPAGWTMLPNSSYDLVNARYPGDSFFAGHDVIGGIQPNISITCLKVRADQATTDAFRAAWQAFVDNLTGQKVTAQPRAVDGATAYQFDYGQAQQAGASALADRTDVVLVQGTCRWMFTMLAPPGKRATYLPALTVILDSFRAPL